MRVHKLDKRSPGKGVCAEQEYLVFQISHPLTNSIAHLNCQSLQILIQQNMSKSCESSISERSLKLQESQIIPGTELQYTREKSRD